MVEASAQVRVRVPPGRRAWGDDPGSGRSPKPASRVQLVGSPYQCPTGGLRFGIVAYADPYDDRLRAARRRHYRANKQQYLDRNKRQRERLREVLREEKEGRPCRRCGIVYPPVAMDYHHRDPAEKGANFKRLISRGSERQLRAEIEKCDVLCSNCHRIEHLS